MGTERCPYWNEYHSLGGWVRFCEIVAYGREVDLEELEKIGCTREKREICRREMEQVLGMGIVPETKETKEPVRKVSIA